MLSPYVKEITRSIHKQLKEKGYAIPQGHVYEVLSKVENFDSSSSADYVELRSITAYYLDWKSI